MYQNVQKYAKKIKKYEKRPAKGLWYWCYYLHPLKDSVSPVCVIFFNDK